MRVLRLAAVLASVVAASAAAAQSRPLFTFGSGFWVNLHHYLHALARAGAPLNESLPAEASAAERAEWTAAIDGYRSRWAKASLLFDAALVRTNEGLARAAEDSLKDAALTPGHRELLEGAAPIYRKYFWAAHDSVNRRFIADVSPLLARHGEAIAARLTKSFDTTWPAEPIPVDLVHDAGPPGNAYTVSEPTHITIGARDPRHAGLDALELVFHEASHRWDATLMKDVSDAARRLDLSPPRDLWHALLFINAGLIVNEVLEQAGTTRPMYMVQQRMFDRAYRGWQTPLEAHWPEFLAGRISRGEAVARILRELPPR